MSGPIGREGKIDLPRPTLRWRLFQWLIGAPPPKLYSASISLNTDYRGEDAAMKQASSMGGRSFTIIDAENGKIIQYMSRDTDNNANRIHGFSQLKFRVVPDGVEIMEAIAAALAVERMKK